MKYFIFIIIAIGLLMIIGSGMAQQLSDTEAKDLQYAREEEKLARDIYLAFHAEYTHHMFEHIAASEQRHMEKVKSLLDTYELTDPIEEIHENRGQFNNPEVQNLYDELYERGMKSFSEALLVGAYIEEMDIRDLQTQISQTENAQLKGTYEKLLNASHHHLQAFVKNLGKQGTDYRPVLLDAQCFDEIIAEGKTRHQQKGKKGKGHKGKDGENCKSKANCCKKTLNE